MEIRESSRDHKSRHIRDKRRSTGVWFIYALVWLYFSCKLKPATISSHLRLCRHSWSSITWELIN